MTHQNCKVEKPRIQLLAQRHIIATDQVYPNMGIVGHNLSECLHHGADGAAFPRPNINRSTNHCPTLQLTRRLVGQTKNLLSPFIQVGALLG